MRDYTQIPIPDIELWSTDQILAVYDLCQMISATLMARHKDQLLEKMLDIDRRRGINHFDVAEYDDNLQLPFDDIP